MILFLRPKGRGCWRVVTMVIEGMQGDLFRFRRNALITLVDRVYRITKVIP